MTEQSTLMTLLLMTLDTDHPRTSVDTCRWTAADADVKISASANLCEWRLSI